MEKKLFINYFININPVLSIKTFIFFIIIINIFIYVVAPRNWSPSGESYRSWAASQISIQSNEFGSTHVPQLYNLYLKIFFLFDYPNSIIYEHYITHLFCYVSILILLTKFLPLVPSILFTIALIP